MDTKKLEKELIETAVDNSLDDEETLIDDLEDTEEVDDIEIDVPLYASVEDFDALEFSIEDIIPFEG